MSFETFWYARIMKKTGFHLLNSQIVLGLILGPAIELDPEWSKWLGLDL
jgi:hypothetical protein